MLLYTHPLNDAREAQGLLPVNSFWLSGCGRAQAARGDCEPTVDARLRGPRWPRTGRPGQGLGTLDAGPLAITARPRPRRPCSSRCAANARGELRTCARAAWQRLTARAGATDARRLLETL
jgi:hypothetical protein